MIVNVILAAIAKFLDAFKFSQPRYWAIFGAIFVAAEAILLSGILKFPVPVYATEIIVGVALYFNNSSSSNIVTMSADGKSAGSLLDEILAKFVEQLKTNNVAWYTVLQSIFISAKFYITADPTLTLPQLAFNSILSISMLFTVPRTKPILAKMGWLKESIRA